MPPSVLVVADPADPGAASLAATLGGRAALVTPADLSVPGWTYRPDPLRRSGCSGAVGFLSSDLSHVVVRLVAVFPQHVLHVVARDRDYVAAEMTAFLRAWLADLPCHVGNRASTVDLSGPGWTPEGWALAAARAGVPALPVGREVPGATGSAGVEAALRALTLVRVHVAGASAVPDTGCDPDLLDRARRVVSAAGLVLATVGFDGADASARLTHVEPRPDLTDPLVRRVVEGWLS